ncbi:MAG: hypothetical protein ACREE2_20530 [Stellaceae bacterium]
MHNLLKSTALGAALLAGLAITAQAQSVSSLPPTSQATPPVTAAPPLSTAKIYPNPGISGSWKDQHYQPTQSDNTPARHPYTTPHFGPTPN